MLPADELPLQEECEVRYFGATFCCAKIHAGHHETPGQPQSLRQGQKGELLTVCCDDLPPVQRGMLLPVGASNCQKG